MPEFAPVVSVSSAGFVLLVLVLLYLRGPGGPMSAGG